MSDYRYQIVEHDGIQCLHVMTEISDHSVLLPNVENGVAHAYIPVDDIQKSIEQYGTQRMQNVLLEAGIEALEVLRSLMNDPVTSANMRLRCAKLIQDHIGARNTITAPEMHIEIPKMPQEQTID